MVGVDIMDVILQEVRWTSYLELLVLENSRACVENDV